MNDSIKLESRKSEYVNILSLLWSISLHISESPLVRHVAWIDQYTLHIYTQYNNNGHHVVWEKDDATVMVGIN